VREDDKTDRKKEKQSFFSFCTTQIKECYIQHAINQWVKNYLGFNNYSTTIPYHQVSKAI
jgi:hypothetical protein